MFVHVFCCLMQADVQDWTAKNYMAALGIEERLLQDLVNQTSIAQASGEDIRTRLKFLTSMLLSGPFSVAAQIRCHFAYNQQLWPLLDTSLPLEELVSFLHAQGATSLVCFAPC